MGKGIEAGANTGKRRKEGNGKEGEVGRTSREEERREWKGRTNL